MRTLIALIICLPIAVSASGPLVDQSFLGQDVAPVTASSDKLKMTASALFATGSHELSAAAKDAIEPLVTRFRHSSLHHYRVIGYADSRGSRNYNLGLSTRRANTVKDYLIERGVHPARVETLAFGERRAAVNILDTADLVEDRRVVITVESASRIGSARLAKEG